MTEFISVMFQNGTGKVAPAMVNLSHVEAVTPQSAPNGVIDEERVIICYSGQQEEVASYGICVGWDMGHAPNRRITRDKSLFRQLQQLITDLCARSET